MNPQPTITPPSRPGWWKRNWKWFVPVTLVCMLLLGAGVIALIVTLVMGTVKSSTPYTMALAQAKADPAVIAELGTPIEAGWYVTGSISTSGQNGNADLSIPIHGPNKSATLHVIALKSAMVAGMEDWKITKLEMTVDGRSEPIDLQTDSDVKPSAAAELEPESMGQVSSAANEAQVSETSRGIPGGMALAPQEGVAPAPPSAGVKDLPKVISGGVLNGKAITLPQPTLPPLAKAAKAGGTVIVQVMLDEDGKVISAHAVSGHPLLKPAAVQAAYAARFTPTKLSGQAVKVTGVITYNFVQP